MDRRRPPDSTPRGHDATAAGLDCHQISRKSSRNDSHAPDVAVASSTDTTQCPDHEDGVDSGKASAADMPFDPVDVERHARSYRRPPSGTKVEAPGSHRRTMRSPLDGPTSRSHRPAMHTGPDLDTLRSTVLPNSTTPRMEIDPAGANSQNRNGSPGMMRDALEHKESSMQVVGLSPSNARTGGRSAGSTPSMSVADGQYARPPEETVHTSSRPSSFQAAKVVPSMLRAAGRLEAATNGQFGSVQGEIYTDSARQRDSSATDASAQGDEWAGFTAGAGTLDPRTLEFGGSLQGTPDDSGNQRVRETASMGPGTSNQTATEWQPWDEQVSQDPPPQVRIGMHADEPSPASVPGSHQQQLSVGPGIDCGIGSDSLGRGALPAPGGFGRGLSAPQQRGFGFATPEHHTAAGHPDRMPAAAAGLTQQRRLSLLQSFSHQGVTATGRRTAPYTQLAQFPPASAGIVQDEEAEPYEFSYIDYIFGHLDKSAALVASSDDDSLSEPQEMPCMCLDSCCPWGTMWQRRA